MERTERHAVILTRHVVESAGGTGGVSGPHRDRRLTRVRRGAYVSTEEWQAARSAVRYRYFVEGTVAAMRTRPMLSHESAAVVLGLPIIGSWPSRVHVVAGAAGGGRSSRFIAKHGVQAPPPVVMMDGHAVTTVARTVLDMARTRPFASALASADHALREGLVTEEELWTELEALRGARGYRLARRAVECADKRAESVGESLSRARMYELRLPLPDLQRSFLDEDGFVGRVDFWWEDLRLIGEFDGVAKYRREGYAGVDDPAEIVWREKRREDRLRALVSGVVRWTWAEAWDADRFRFVMERAGVSARR